MLLFESRVQNLPQIDASLEHQICCTAEYVALWSIEQTKKKMRSGRKSYELSIDAWRLFSRQGTLPASSRKSQTHSLRRWKSIFPHPVTCYNSYMTSPCLHQKWVANLATTFVSRCISSRPTLSIPMTGTPTNKETIKCPRNWENSISGDATQWPDQFACLTTFPIRNKVIDSATSVP